MYFQSPCLKLPCFHFDDYAPQFPAQRFHNLLSVSGGGRSGLIVTPPKPIRSASNVSTPFSFPPLTHLLRFLSLAALGKYSVALYRRASTDSLTMLIPKTTPRALVDTLLLWVYWMDSIVVLIPQFCRSRRHAAIKNHDEDEKVGEGQQECLL